MTNRDKPFSFKKFMTRIVKIRLILFFLGVLCTSCKKSPITGEPLVPVPVVPEVPVPDKPTSEIPSNSVIYEVGTGSGSLTIDGNTLKINKNSLIKIKGGSYTEIIIKNIILQDGNTAFIQNDGLVELYGNGRQMTISNVKNLTITGNGSKGINKGFAFGNNNYRAIQMSKSVDKLTLKNMSFENVSDYVISYNSDKIYNGSDESYSKDLKFLNMYCSNSGPFLIISGSITDVSKGYLKNIEIANLKYVNSDYVGDVVFIGNVKNYDIHNNTVQNVNSKNNNHNGIFHLLGNGKFYNNLIRDHQGNALRAWLYSVENTESVDIYNNIVYNSSRYGAFELQVVEDLNKSTLFKPANSKIYNNTIGRLNTGEPKYFEGRLLDLYRTYGTLEIYNNLSFELKDNILINKMSDTKILTNQNNIYKETAKEAVVDVVNFKSLVAGVGASQ